MPPFLNSSLKLIKPSFLVLMLGGFLVACGGSGDSSSTSNSMGNNTETPSDDQNQNGETEAPAGANASITKSVYDISNSTPFPTAIYLKLRGNALSTFNITDNQTSIESGSLPIGDLIGPASGLRSAYSQIERVIVLPENTDHMLSFSINTPDQEFDSVEQTFSIAGKNCMSNQTFYFTYIERELNNSCGSCHSNRGTASGWSIDEGFSGLSDYAADRGEVFYERPTSQYHGGGRRWDMDDEEVLRMAEFVYRSKNGFVCP